jgi:tartrate dehydrogenase/decarboxylase/D-malate dehydrogenase
MGEGVKNRMRKYLQETTMATYTISVIPGDGIGREVVPEGIRVLERAGGRYGIAFKWEMLPWSCQT